MAKNITYRISSVDILDFSLHAKENTEKGKLKFKVDLRAEFKSNSNLILITCNVTIINHKDIILASIESLISFEVSDLSRLYQPGKEEIPTAFVKNLNSIAVSTTRGLMYSTFKGTFLHNAVLPLIDINEIEYNTTFAN